MNIQELNQLIPEPYRDITVPETLMYYRNSGVYPITEEFVAEKTDFIFKYKKTNGVVEIEEIKIDNIPQTLITAENWVQKYFTNLEVLALMRLEQTIISSGKSLGPKMQASKQWLESMMFAQPSNNFLPAPFSYMETSTEAAQTLNS